MNVGHSKACLISFVLPGSTIRERERKRERGRGRGREGEGSRGRGNESKRDGNLMIDST